VYSSQALKAKKLKSKLEWLLVRNVVDHRHYYCISRTRSA